jgi:hypothetical protein
MGVIADLQRGLAEHVVGLLDGDAKRRLAALHAASGVWTDADVYDRLRMARWILTGSEDEPAPPDYAEVTTLGGEKIRLEKRAQTEDYPFFSGDVLVLGPQIYASNDDPRPDTVISWRGVNFVPQPGFFSDESQGLTGVVGPDPEFEKALEREPAPSEGQGWRGRRGS